MHLTLFVPKIAIGFSWFCRFLWSIAAARPRVAAIAQRHSFISALNQRNAKTRGRKDAKTQRLETTESIRIRDFHAHHVISGRDTRDQRLGSARLDRGRRLGRDRISNPCHATDLICDSAADFLQQIIRKPDKVSGHCFD